MITEATLEELHKQDKEELRRLTLDYQDLSTDYDTLLEQLRELKNKLAPTENQQLRLANARIRTSEAYLEAYSEYYGELPTGLHQAVLLMSAIPHMPDETRKKHARELAHEAKRMVAVTKTFLNKAKGWFT